MRSVAAILLGVCFSVLASVIGAFVIGGLNPQIAAIALLVGALVGFFTFWKLPPWNPKPVGLWDGIVGVLFTIVFLRIFLWLVFIDGDSIKYISSNNLGDLSYHLTLIRYFANGIPFWPEDPIYSGVPLSYFFGIDLFNSLLTLCGVDVYRGMIWVGLGGALMTGITIFQWGGSFTLAGFLLNGGIAGFAFFYTGIVQDYQFTVDWKNIPTALFVTQRALLYGLPCGLLLLCHWRQKYFSESKTIFLPFWVEFLLYATLPFFHFYTFLYMTFLLAYWFVFENSNIRRSILRLWAFSFIPVLILLYFVTGVFHKISVIHFAEDWTQGHQGFFQFWFYNMGFLPFFILALCFKLWWKRRDLAIQHGHPGSFVIPAIGIFILSCWVMFAPWPWDNIKLLMWSYLILLPFLWEYLLKSWNIWLRAISCFLLFFSGFISLFGGIDYTHQEFVLASRTELDLVEKEVKNLPSTAIFAAYPIYNHPLLLNGRKMTLGYLGHVWSHGIDPTEREKKLNNLMQGNPGWEKIAKELDIRYIFWGEREKSHFLASKQPWKRDHVKVSSGTWGEIYDLNTPIEQSQK